MAPPWAGIARDSALSVRSPDPQLPPPSHGRCRLVGTEMNTPKLKLALALLLFFVLAGVAIAGSGFGGGWFWHHWGVGTGDGHNHRGNLRGRHPRCGSYRQPNKKTLAREGHGPFAGGPQENHEEAQQRISKNSLRSFPRSDCSASLLALFPPVAA